ncbi:superoxide dismutase [Patescibacteria group bacterium]|nr:superoxide dismutase [Patescibacteria group bacterium]
MFTLPNLPYSYDALGPHLDKQTMELHHTKHHATYVNKLNEALAKAPQLKEKSIEWLLTNLSEVPEDIRTAVVNHGGGHYNHSLFWQMMSPDKVEPPVELVSVINNNFGSVEKFQEQFNQAAVSLFGSGWVWLVKKADNNLAITTTFNQGSPLSQGLQPLLGLDVWEHAYYLKWQNKRADYVATWWQVVNWPVVAKNLLS